MAHQEDAKGKAQIQCDNHSSRILAQGLPRSVIGKLEPDAASRRFEFAKMGVRVNDLQPYSGLPFPLCTFLAWQCICYSVSSKPFVIWGIKKNPHCD